MEEPLSDRERWDRRYREGDHASGPEPAWLDELDALLPRHGRALDVAAGAGRVACWVARRGLDVLAVDVSPVGLDLARARAEQSGLTIETRALDLHTEPLPAESFALVTCLGYLQRSLFPALRAVLAPQGVLVCGIPTVRNLERHPRPPADFLVEEGELRELVAPLEVLYYREGWIDDRCVARVAARRV